MPRKKMVLQVFGTFGMYSVDTGIYFDFLTQLRITCQQMCYKMATIFADIYASSPSNVSHISP